MSNNVYDVLSNQTDLHANLVDVVVKHDQFSFQKAVSSAANNQLALILPKLRAANYVVIDSGCGTGDSCLYLTKRYPEAIVLAIDKSAYRLQKARARCDQYPNIVFLSGDCVEYWRLIVAENISIKSHYLFYPNPWPKAKHLLRRWHGHPVFPLLIAMSPVTELRSNWLLYLEEFAAACHLLGYHDVEILPVDKDSVVSAFERKYQRCGQKVYRLLVKH